MSNSKITNFYMVVIRLFTIVPARVSTMVLSRTERPVTVINVSFIIIVMLPLNVLFYFLAF